MNFLFSSLEPEKEEKMVLIMNPEEQVSHISHGRTKFKSSVYSEEEFKHAPFPTKANTLTFKLPSIANWEML